MCAKKISKKPRSTRVQDDAAPSKKQKPAENIEFPSDSDLDVVNMAGEQDHQQEEKKSQAIIPAALVTTPATKRKAGDEDAKDDAPAPPSSASKRQRKLAVRVKHEEAAARPVGGADGNGDDDSGLVVRKTHLEISAPARSMHVNFGDDEDNEKFFTPMERPLKQDMLDVAAAVREGAEDSEDESESDDDAPPEAVSSHAAAHQLIDRAKHASKAIEMQATSKRLKRQRRDALFKMQARKRALDDGESATGPEAAAASSSSRTPTLLPAEFLESDDEREVEEKPMAEEPRRPKKIKFETAERQSARQEGRGVADRRDGDTVYKVVRPVADARLAPRASKRTAFDKKKLLSRGRVEVRKKGGFLLK